MQRIDESDDSLFYREPRLVVHVDDNFIATLSQFYAEHLPEGGVILDLMSSYKSHLPMAYKPQHVTGLGMNAVELQANTQLNDYVVQNLNKNPKLPFEDSKFDAVLNTVSIQYVLKPLELFNEVGRVLKPGGVHIVSFSNRMFPTKAIQAWRESDEADRVELVEGYFRQVMGFEEPQVFEKQAAKSKGSWSFFRTSNDPVYIVWSRKKAA